MKKKVKRLVLELWCGAGAVLIVPATMFGIVLLIAGCKPSAESKAVNDLEVVNVSDGFATATVQIVKLHGHRVAVAIGNGKVAICEVTSNSLWAE